MPKVKFRAHFDYDVEKASDEAGVSFVGVESMTVQSMAEDADINVIVARYGITGKMPEDFRVPMYEDFTNVVDYQSGVMILKDAHDEFMRLPAKVRARFSNDPQQLLDFVSDEENRTEAIRLGLLREEFNVKPQPTNSGGEPGGTRSTGGPSVDVPPGGGETPSGGVSAAPGAGKKPT